tara:strand:- start:1034 stop:1567 length:534 start_codon:yes stop_codon:yes gene_type:complete
MGNISDTKVFKDEQKHFDDSDFREYAEPSDEKEIVADDKNVEKILYSYQFVEGNIDRLKERREASLEFYDQEIKKAEKNLEYKRNILRSYLESNGQKTMKFSNGTVSVRKSTKHIHSGSEKKLIEWCEENDKNNEFGLIKEVRKPSKSAIIKFVKDTGFTPEDWDIVEKSLFKVKTQ